MNFWYLQLTIFFNQSIQITYIIHIISKISFIVEHSIDYSLE